jgi:Ca2+/Na+ antiporter
VSPPPCSWQAATSLPIFITGQQIDRWEGALFFGYYIAYALYLKAPLWTNRF